MFTEIRQIFTHAAFNRTLIFFSGCLLLLSVAGHAQIGGADAAGTMTRDAYKKFISDTFDERKVPSRYNSDLERFKLLSTDPAHNDTISADSRAEAMAGLEAEKQGLVKAPIERGPKEIEFYDADGLPWDVKTPFIYGSTPTARANSIKQNGEAILKQLGRGAEFKWSDPLGGESDLRPVSIILNITSLSKDDYDALETWLKSKTNDATLQRIVRVSLRNSEDEDDEKTRSASGRSGRPGNPGNLRSESVLGYLSTQGQ